MLSCGHVVWPSPLLIGGAASCQAQDADNAEKKKSLDNECCRRWTPAVSPPPQQHGT